MPHAQDIGKIAFHYVADDVATEDEFPYVVQVFQWVAEVGELGEAVDRRHQVAGYGAGSVGVVRGDEVMQALEILH